MRSNGGGPAQLPSARLLAAVAEFGSRRHYAHLVKQGFEDSGIEIRSSDGRRSLRFHSRSGDYFVASVEGDGPLAALRVWGYVDCHLLVDLFASLSHDWQGWQGERTWASIEGEFRIIATTTRTGRVTLMVELTHTDGTDDWRVSVPIFAEAGQLDSIAHRVASFFS